jgi:hypothetical protein
MSFSLLAFMPFRVQRKGPKERATYHLPVYDGFPLNLKNSRVLRNSLRSDSRSLRLPLALFPADLEV